jgi:hypothetical protein
VVVVVVVVVWLVVSWLAGWFSAGFIPPKIAFSNIAKKISKQFKDLVKLRVNVNQFLYNYGARKITPNNLYRC